jgi:hypothetical protein
MTAGAINTIDQSILGQVSKLLEIALKSDVPFESTASLL